MKEKLQKEIGNLSRLRSVEQVRQKKQQVQQKQMMTDLSKQKNNLEYQHRFQEYLNRELQVGIGMMHEKKVEKIISNNKQKHGLKPEKSRSRSRSRSKSRPQSRQRSGSGDEKARRGKVLKDDLGAMHVLKNKFNFQNNPTDDEYTLGNI